MVITFIGHSTLNNYGSLRVQMKKEIIANLKDNEKIFFYCGGYGDFDVLCESVCHELKRDYENCEIIYITPYITEAQQKKMKCWLEEKRYDSIIYPPLEDVLPKFSISKRNEWMIKQADLIIAYVNHSYGGAYTSLMYAKRHKKNIINLSQASWDK